MSLTEFVWNQWNTLLVSYDIRSSKQRKQQSPRFAPQMQALMLALELWLFAVAAADETRHAEASLAKPSQ